MIQFEIRKTWRNHLGNQRIDPLRIYEPRTIAEVQELPRVTQETQGDAVTISPRLVDLSQAEQGGSFQHLYQIAFADRAGGEAD